MKEHEFAEAMYAEILVNINRETSSVFSYISTFSYIFTLVTRHSYIQGEESHVATHHSPTASVDMIERDIKMIFFNFKNPNKSRKITKK